MQRGCFLGESAPFAIPRKIFSRVWKGNVKNTRNVKMKKFHGKGGKMKSGLPEDVRARIAYWDAWVDFMTRMYHDPRFVWLYGDERGL